MVYNPKLNRLQENYTSQDVSVANVHKMITQSNVEENKTKKKLQFTSKCTRDDTDSDWENDVEGAEIEVIADEGTEALLKSEKD